MHLFALQKSAPASCAQSAFDAQDPPAACSSEHRPSFALQTSPLAHCAVVEHVPPAACGAAQTFALQNSAPSAWLQSASPAQAPPAPSSVEHFPSFALQTNPVPH